MTERNSKKNIEIFNSIGQTYENEFKTLRKKATREYRDFASTSVAMGKTAVRSKELKNIRDRDSLVNFMDSALTQPDRSMTLSKELYSSDANYSKIVEYFVNMYHYRHITSLNQLEYEQEVSDEDLIKNYNLSVSLVDGLSINVMYKKLMRELILSGAVYLTTYKQTGAKTISTLILPKDFCRTGPQTNFHTNIVQFNFKFFDAFKASFDTEKSIFNYFPSEFKKLYQEYKINKDKEKKPEWRNLDARSSTSILANEAEIPPLLPALFGIKDYESYQKNELQKNENQLEKILVHKIDTYQGDLIFSLPEVKSLHKAMQKIASGNDKLKVLTTFGNTELLDLQKDSVKEHKILSESYANIFSSAGLNSNLFTSNTVEGLRISIKMDAAMVWGYIEQFSNFFSLALNKFYNLSPLQLKIRILNIDVFNEIQQVEQYVNNAQYGIGVTEAIIANGIPQREIGIKLRVEDLLDFNTMMKPLQSSHTQSGDDATESEEDVKKKSKEVE